MNSLISPGKISGSIIPPPSKSMMQRVCAAALLHKGMTTIFNPGYSNDDLAALNIIQQLGAKVSKNNDGSISIISKGVLPVSDTIDCGESGLSARLFTPIAAISGKQITITGHGSLLQRPMTEFAEILPSLGVGLIGFNGHLPLTLKGPMKAGNLRLDGSISSQYLTGILFALAFTADGPTTITVDDLQSKPYIDLSLQVLDSFGKIVTHNGYHEFYFDPRYAIVAETIEQTIESDWSSAAAWVVAGALSGSISIRQLNKNSVQADRKILEVLAQCGVDYSWQNDTLHIQSSSVLKSFSFDASSCPDLFPLLSVLAASCAGTSRIKGINRLVHKESNRAETIAAMLLQLGVDFKAKDNSFEINGRERLNNCVVSSHNDHRIVMAAAIASLRTEKGITIEHAEAVSKSYPDFFKHLQTMGLQILT